MKFMIFYNKLNFVLIILFFFLNIQLLNAEESIEKDFRELTTKLRCMTCQNQTIYESEADFSKDIKKIIRQKLSEGQSQKEISDFLVERYSEYILFEPKFDQKNIFLWTFPFVVFFICAVFLFIRIKKNRISK